MTMASSSSWIPSDDWELNIVLLKIAKQLDRDDFDSIKFLCSGHAGIPKNVLEKLSSPEKLFTYLRERSMLSRDNLLLLQAFLWHVGRSDLIDIAADYASQAGDTLYFYAPSREPENGYRHVKFHVKGSLRKFHRKDLEDMRANVARLLFVPPEFVFLCGLEPTNSLLLTFMLHSTCIERLKSVVRTRNNVLRDLGTVAISVDSEVITIQEEENDDEEEDDCTSELSSLFKKTVRLENLLEKTDERLLTTREEAQRIEKEAQEWQYRESYIRGLFCAALDGKRSSPTSNSVPTLVRLEDGRIII